MRKAVLAGREDTRASDRLWEAWRRCMTLYYEAEYPQNEDARASDVILKELAEIEAEFDQKLRSYHQYLRKRLRWS
jgi:hypothetical protein